MQNQTILEGIVSITAALDAQSRPIERLLLQEGKRTRPIGYLRRRAQEVNIPIEVVSEGEITNLAGGHSHGGAVAIAGERRYCSIGSLVDKQGNSTHSLLEAGQPEQDQPKPGQPEQDQSRHKQSSLNQAQTSHPFIVMLDGIEDPFNFGYAVRAVYAAGADGLIVRPRNWLSAAGTVARASAGASERIPTAVAESIDVAAGALRQLGLRVACTAKEGATDLYQVDLSVPLFLVIGGEKRGITRSFIETADILINIPYGRPFAQSMGTAAATSVLAFEVMRQRKQSAS